MLELERKSSLNLCLSQNPVCHLNMLWVCFMMNWSRQASQACSSVLETARVIWLNASYSVLNGSSLRHHLYRKIFTFFMFCIVEMVTDLLCHAKCHSQGWSCQDWKQIKCSEWSRKESVPPTDHLWSDGPKVMSESRRCVRDFWWEITDCSFPPPCRPLLFFSFLFFK